MAFLAAYKKIHHINLELWSPAKARSGKTDMQIIKERMTESGVPEAIIDAKMNECFDCMIEHYKTHAHRDSCVILSVVQEILDRCKKEHILLGLVTGNVEQIAYEKLKKIGIDDYFAFGAFGNESALRAQLVQMAIQRARQRGLRVQDKVFLVGDTPRDIDAAKGKATSIGVATGMFTAFELREAGADHVFENLCKTEELLALFRSA